MYDETEVIRRERQAELNAAQAVRDELEKDYGQVWNTKELGDEFEVLGFMAPFCVVRRKSDNTKGSVEFQHMPRFYFNFVKD